MKHTLELFLCLSFKVELSTSGPYDISSLVFNPFQDGPFWGYSQIMWG